MPHIIGYRSPSGYAFPGRGSVLDITAPGTKDLIGHWMPQQQAVGTNATTPVYSSVPRGDIVTPSSGTGISHIGGTRFGWVWSFDGTNKITFYDTSTNAPTIFKLNVAPFVFTVSMWIRNNSASATVMNLGALSPNNTGFCQWMLRQLGTSQALSFVVRDSADTAFTATGTRNLGDNQWHHVVGTWDAKFVKCYVDGVLEASTAYGGTGIPDSFVSGLLIGDAGADAQRYSGQMTNLMMWRRCLQEPEIKMLHQDPFIMYLARGIIPEAIPVPTAITSTHWSQFGNITRLAP